MYLGVITANDFQDPYYYINGEINTKNRKLKEDIRKALKSGELKMLSIGFTGLYDEENKVFLEKTFNEASLVYKVFLKKKQHLVLCRF